MSLDPYYIPKGRAARKWSRIYRNMNRPGLSLRRASYWLFQLVRWQRKVVREVEANRWYRE